MALYGRVYYRPIHNQPVEPVTLPSSVLGSNGDLPQVLPVHFAPTQYGPRRGKSPAPWAPFRKPRREEGANIPFTPTFSSGSMHPAP